MRQQRVLRSTGQVLGTVGRGMTEIGAGMAYVGYKSARAAIDFQKSMQMISTQAGAGQGEVNKMTQAVLALGQSGQVIQGPKVLADSLFHLESVGLRGTSAMKALKIAMQGAAVGGADAEQTASALAALWRADMPGAGNNFARAMGVINATVGQGNMRMQDLVQALGTGVMPAFKNAGLNVYDAGSALATFADAGYNVSSAASQMSTALHFLYQPTTKASKALAGIGMGTYQMALDMHKPNGLLVAMQDLKQHLDTLPGGTSGVAAEQVLGSILPGGRGRIMLTLLNNLDTYRKKLIQIQKQTGDFHNAVKQTEQTMSFKLHAAWAKIQTDMVKFGTTLLPIISTWLPRFTSAITGLLGWVTKLSPQMKSLLSIMAVGFLVGGPILIGLSKLLSAWRAIRDMLYSIRTAAIAAAGAEEAAAGAGGLAGFGGAAATLGRRVAPLAGAYAAMKLLEANQRAQARHQRMKSILTYGGAGAGAGAGIGALVFGVPTAGLGAPLGAALGAVGGGAAGLGVGALRAFGILHSGGYVTPSGVRHFASGGYAGDNIPAWLQAGEGVLSRVGMANLAALNTGFAGGATGGLGGTITASPVYLVLDGRVLAQSVIKYTLQRAARGPSNLVGGGLMTGVSTPVQRG